MRRRSVRFVVSVWLLMLLSCCPAISIFAQAPADNPAETLKEIQVEGVKRLSVAQVTAISGLATGSAVSKPDLQAAADRLVQTGLFSNVRYAFKSKEDGLYLTFSLVETPRIPAYFDNFPWFADSELTEAIRKALPFYDGTLPEAGAVVDQVSSILTDLIATRGMRTEVDHQVIASPLGEGTVQEFRIADVVLQISKIEFGDPALSSSKALQQHLGEVQGKPYSRMLIDLFLSEQVKPLYVQKGFLQVKLGPPEIRLSGNPNQKLPEQIPVFVPVTAGPVYRWKSAQWSGNSALSGFTLNNLLGLKPGDVANELAIEAGWTRVREDYGQRGYLAAKVDPVVDFDDQAHTVSYNVAIHEGQPFKFEKLVITGLSPTAERRLRAAWPILTGDTFDKSKFESILLDLQLHHERVFVDLPLHYDSVGHWLQTNDAAGTVDVLLDFK